MGSSDRKKSERKSSRSHREHGSSRGEKDRDEERYHGYSRGEKRKHREDQEESRDRKRDRDNEDDGGHRGRRHKHSSSSRKRSRDSDRDRPSRDAKPDEKDDQDEKRREKDTKDKKKERDRSSRKKDDRKKDSQKKKRKKDSSRRRDKHRSKDDDDDDSSGRVKGTSRKEAKKIRKSTIPNKDSLTSLGEILGSPPLQLLDAEKDYFAYHRHLWVFLYREEGVAFNDLTSEETHEAFCRFVKRYNAGELEAGYYDPKGLPHSALEECKTTRHSWSFKTSEREEQSLRTLQEGVRKQTEYDVVGGDDGSADAAATNQASMSKNEATGPDDMDRGRKSAEDRYGDRVKNRRLKAHVRAVEEELTDGRGKDIGSRERQIEKRKEQAARIHGAARDKEAAAGIELDDAAIYGGEGQGDAVSFQAALAREKQRAAQREEKRQKHIEELRQKEKDKQEEMLKKLGLTGIKPGQKIQIAPRKDT